MNHPLPRLSAAVAAVLLASACTSATLNDTPTSASTQQSSAASSAAPGASQPSASVTIDPSLRSIVRSGVPEVRYARSLGTLAVYTKGSNSAWVLYSNGGSRVAAGRWTADEAEPVRDGFLALSCSKKGALAAKLIEPSGQITTLGTHAKASAYQPGDLHVTRCGANAWLYRQSDRTLHRTLASASTARQAADGSLWRMNTSSALRSVDGGRTWTTYDLPRGGQGDTWLYLLVGGIFFSPQQQGDHWGAALVRPSDGSGRWHRRTLPGRRGDGQLLLRELPDGGLLLALTPKQWSTKTRWWVCTDDLASCKRFAPREPASNATLNAWGERLFAIGRTPGAPMFYSDDLGATWSGFER